MTAQPSLESPIRGAPLSGERKVLELIATGASLADTLDALCRVIDEQSGLLSSVYLLNREGDQLSLAAGPLLAAEWRDATRVFCATPTHGACGAAVHQRRQVIVPDVVCSRLFDPWREAANIAGIGSVWSTPFFSKSGQVLGTFAVFAREPGNPNDAHLGLVARATHLASIAVERHMTEQELQESEIRFSRTFYANPASLTIASISEGRLTYVNDAFVRLFGYSRAEAVGQTAAGLGLYVDPPHRVAATERLLVGQAREVEVEGRTKSGEIRTLIVSLERIEVLGEESVLGIATDITARKRAEEAVAASEYRWRSVFDNSAIGIVIGDAALRITAANTALQALGGYNERELTSLTFLDVTHPDDRHLVTEAANDVLEGRVRERQIEKRHVRKDGDVIWVRATLSRCLDANHAASLVALVEDVTARKHAEEALRKSERLLRLVLESIPVGVAVMDPDGRIILRNPASTHIWGGELIRDGAERWAAIKGWRHDSGERIEPGEWASIRALAKGDTSINEVIDIETFDGRRKIIQNSAVPIRDNHEAIVGAVVVNEDISARKTAEAAEEASMRQMQALATRLMHAQDDERRRIAQMLHETTAQDLAGLKMLLARLTRSGDRLSDTDRSLLADAVELADRSMTDIRTLSYLLHPPFLDETGLLSAIRWYAEGFAGRSGVTVELDLPKSFERLPQDVETTLFRIVQEALINIHRHAESRTAHIRLRIKGDRLMLEIQDHGRGMSADLVSRLVAGGSALGVGIAGMRERLKQFAGTLEIESGDRGTLLRAVLPLPARAAS
jgi:PAS domain S-box-containing protein